MVTLITSTQNERVKAWKKLHSAKGRKKANSYLIETWHLIEEAQKSNHLLECMLSQEAFDRYHHLINVPITIISDEVCKDLSQTMTSTGIFGVVEIALENNLPTSGKWILLDGLQDPGNVGTIIRTADAAGFSGVIVGEGSVDIFNDKTIRSMQGSQFHVALYKGDLAQYITHLKQHGVTVYASELNEKAKHLFAVEPIDQVAIVVGNEGNGVSQAILNQCDNSIYIPILGQAESLNAAVAASIMMYHFVKGENHEN